MPRQSARPKRKRRKKRAAMPVVVAIRPLPRTKAATDALAARAALGEPLAGTTLAATEEECVLAGSRERSCHGFLPVGLMDERALRQEARFAEDDDLRPLIHERPPWMRSAKHRRRVEGWIASTFPWPVAVRMAA